MTDEQLVRACIKNDASAQKYLYEKFSRKMMGMALRYCKSQPEAEDVVQLGFIAVFKNISSFTATGSLEGWIKRIVINTALTNIRKNKKLKNQIAIDNIEYALPSSSSASAGIERKELLNIIQTLPLGGRTIFNLFAIEGYSHKEIAEMLNISEGTSKSQYSRARMYLKKVLSKDN